MKCVKKAILILLIFTIFGGTLSADVIATKAKINAPDKGYFSSDIRRVKVAGQQEPEFKEERPIPVPEALGFLLLAGAAVLIGMFAHNNWMRITGLAFSTMAIMGILFFSKGVAGADVIATKTTITTKELSDGLSNKDSKYFAKHENSIQVAGGSEGFTLLGGTVLVVAFIIVMASIAISK